MTVTDLGMSIRDARTPQVVYGNGLRGLVELTSVSIELFRKMAEISLLPQVRVHCVVYTCTCMYIVLLSVLDFIADYEA